MKSKIIFFLLPSILAVFLIGSKLFSENEFIVYTVNPKSQDLKLYWKNESGKNYGSIENLKLSVEKQNTKLDFAMNAGMYNKSISPQGLYIENYKVLVALDTTTATGNFYLKPNGVFYLTAENNAVICKTEDFRYHKNIKYATQSGPMLLVDGKIHSAFKEGSPNLNIRNGVGILSDGKVVFVLSKKEINFYDFALYFKGLGCKNALYLDGFVSRAYVPKENWLQTDGNFGAIFAVTQRKQNN
ncbi:phosphodiester glycosidase family protein [Flavobacterium geliluteum]|uniref:Phosphodiester glycosidase family protein n=1 Tax=Flavobacterium geliluteum TaxID=2816120 RepID=A0A940XDC0_9FLAO|nr:phosphodiester glycosidase family protein [Flavobacterium geliluteum]MBP4137690.1 phosphodiester glycosidase family protein [Flavobacterium geliluteum]